MLTEIKSQVRVAHVTDNAVTEQIKLHGVACAQPVETNFHENSDAPKPPVELTENNFHQGINAPAMSIELTVTRAEAKKFFVPGKCYRVTFAPVE